MNGRFRRADVVSVLFAAVVAVCIVMAPARHLSLSITLEESPEPPKGVQIVPEEELNQVEPVELPAGEAAPAPAAGSAAPPPTSGGAAPAGKEKYKSIFKPWRLMHKVFPLDAAVIGFTGINLMNDANWIVQSSRYTGFGNYFLQGGAPMGLLDTFKGTYNYTRQAKNQLTANTVVDLVGGISRWGVNMAYNRNFKTTSGGGQGQASANKTDNRRLTMTFVPVQKFNLGYAADRSITRTVNSGVSAKTENRKETWTLTSNLSPKTTLGAVHQYTTNWNLYSTASTKTTQTDWRLVHAVTEKISLDAGYQFVGNRGIPAGGAPEAETRKTTRLLGVSYQVTPDLRLRYAYNFADDRNEANLALTNFATTVRETEIQYAVFPWLSLNGKNQVSFSQNAGKTALRQATFNIDHSKRKLMPGVTTVQFNKNLKTAASPLNLRQNVSYTFQSNTPLTYFDGRFSIARQFTHSEQRDSQAFSDQKSVSTSRNYTAALRVTNTFTLSDNLKFTTSDNVQSSAITSLSDNKTSNFQADLMMRRPFTKKFKKSTGVKYTYANNRSLNRNFLPAPGITDTVITKNAGTFMFQGQKWKTDYTVERNVSKPLNGGMSRSIVHKIGWNLNGIRGFNLTGNYSLALQNRGSTAGGVFTMNRDRGRMLESFTYEFSKNQVLGNRRQNTFVRYFEAGVQFKL